MTIADEPSHGNSPGADAQGLSLLDIPDGIGRVMGDRALYARMLARFRKDYGGGVATIQAAIDGADLRLAHRMAHTLKGASGMISAHVLHQQASQLEFALRHAGNSHAEALAGVGCALADVMTVIERVLADEPAPENPPRPARSSPPGEALLAQLAELLAGGDGAAVDLLEQSDASLKAALGEAGFREVALAANDFDFEGALEALGRIVNSGRGTAGT